MSEPKEPDADEEVGSFDADVLPDFAAMMKLPPEELDALTPDQAHKILFPNHPADAKPKKPRVEGGD